MENKHHKFKHIKERQASVLWKVHRCPETRKLAWKIRKEK